MAEGFYHLGDYVYMEVDPAPAPYKVCRLEELSKTAEGRIEALVTSMYRRRDLPTSLAQLADRFSVDFEEQEGCLWSTEELSAKEKHQLKHRELFLCRDYETYEISLIRGKCLVTLLCEVETPDSYLKRPDMFYYSLIYDPQARTLQPDKNIIRVGEKYQAQVSSEKEIDNQTLEETATPLWKPDAMSNKEIDQYMVLARSVGTFARAMITSKTFQPTLHASAAAASRDVTLLHAMTSLHRSGYDLATAVGYLVPQGGPLLCRDEMENWTAEEANIFERALQACGKDFHEIHKEHLPWKSVKSIVEYYYMWKTSDRYTYTKQQKFLERQSKLKDFAIRKVPSSHQAKGGTGGSGPGGKPGGGGGSDSRSSPQGQQKQGKGMSPSTGGGASSSGGNGKGGENEGGNGGKQVKSAAAPIFSPRPCECCKVSSSTRWHRWGPTDEHLQLCNDCSVYWRKYAGFKLPTKWETSRLVSVDDSYSCPHCNRFFTRRERLLTHQREGCRSVTTKSTKKPKAISHTSNKIFMMRPRSAVFLARKLLTSKELRHCSRKLGSAVNLSLLKEKDEPPRRIPRCYRIRDRSWHRVIKNESFHQRQMRLITLDNQIIDISKSANRAPNKKLLHSPQLLVQKHARRVQSREEAMADAVMKAHQEQLKRATAASAMRSVIAVESKGADSEKKMPVVSLPTTTPLDLSNVTNGHGKTLLLVPVTVTSSGMIAPAKTTVPLEAFKETENSRKRRAVVEADNGAKRSTLDGDVKTRRVSPRLSANGSKKTKSAESKPAASTKRTNKKKSVPPWADLFAFRVSRDGKKRREDLLPALRKLARKPWLGPSMLSRGAALSSNERIFNGNESSLLGTHTGAGKASEPIVID